MISTGNEVQIAFITGPNKKGNTDFLRNPFIASTEIIKAVILNEKGMYLQSVIAMYAIQIGLQKKQWNYFYLQKLLMKKFIELI